MVDDLKTVVQAGTVAMEPARAATLRPRRAARAAQATVASETGIVSLTDPPVETVVIKTDEAKGISVRRQPATLVPVDPTLMQAYEALQQGDLALAHRLYQQVLEAEPRSIDALLGLGAIAWKEGRIEEAGQRYQRVLELEPRNAYAQAGLIAIIGGADPQASESRLRLLIAREPSAFLYFTLGNLYADQGQWPGAEQAYFQAFQLQPDNPDYAFNLAVGLEHIGQFRPALDYYRKALDLSFRKGRANFDQNLVIKRVGQLSARVE
jgi:tetratricopeptide (TPR) repeat protein